MMKDIQCQDDGEEDAKHRDDENGNSMRLRLLNFLYNV